MLDAPARQVEGVSSSVADMPKTKKKGILCLEGDWWGLRDSTTVEPVLMLLQRYSGSAVPYVHRDVGTIEEFDYYLAKWSQRGFATHPILYLGFHGSRGVLYMRRKGAEVSLEELADRLEGRCARRVIFFASCGTLDVHGARLNSFLWKTGASAICGYRREVDWLQSTTLELLVLGMLQDCSFAPAGMRRFLPRLRAAARGLVKKLDFRMKVRR